MTDTTIVYVHGRRVWDSRGRPTVEAEMLLSGGAVGRAIAPAGASTGTGEALDLRDGGETFGGFDVSRAVANVNGIIADGLLGYDAADQATVDRRLIALVLPPRKHCAAPIAAGVVEYGLMLIYAAPKCLHCAYTRLRKQKSPVAMTGLSA